MDPRFPALPVAIDEDPDHVIVQADGEIRRHYNLIYKPEDVDRIREGYCCINCGESQVGQKACPLPAACWVCGFPMKEEQAQRFASEFVGDVRVGPSTTIEEELAIADELVQRESHVAKPSIIVPRYF